MRTGAEISAWVCLAFAVAHMAIASDDAAAFIAAAFVIVGLGDKR